MGASLRDPGPGARPRAGAARAGAPAHALNRAGRPDTVSGMSEQRRFGTFGGVFTPCTLTILGVILFLRLGQVVGNSGVWVALGIVLASKAITTLTAFSLSAIATNTQVRGGGAYFMISRSLGPEYGGSIGTVFYLAQAISVAMYVVGFTEACVASFPELAPHSTLVASATNALVFACVFVGAAWAIKVQYAILAVLLLSIGSFCLGALDAFEPELLRANLGSAPSGAGALAMFALFFPAATGIMAGANMSGDLREPSRSIPSGTLGAIAATGVVYLGLVLLLAGSSPREELLTDSLVMRTRAQWPALLMAGIFAATLSSALGSMMGAPRILQALARDNIFPALAPFAQGSRKSGEPRRAIALTFAVAQAAVLLGDLDLIAPIITLFFMVTYGYLNLSTFKESYTRNPSYRPTFRWAHWSTALAGALACGAVMCLVAPRWALVAVGAMALLHFAIARRELRTSWGDVHGGAAYESARKDLLRLEREALHPKNWRPTMLAFSGGAGTRVRMVAFAHWMSAGRGVLSVAQVIAGEMDDLLERRRAQEKVLRGFLREQGFDAFPAVVVAPDRHAGIEALVQCHGLGAFRPNTVVAGWASDPEHSQEFLRKLRTVVELGKNLVLVSTADGADPRRVPPGSVDVWWRGKDNGPLMVLLAHLLLQNPEWAGRSLRLLRVVASEQARADSEQHLEALLSEARIQGQVRVVVDDDPVEAIQRESEAASVVFVGLQLPDADESAEVFVERYEALLTGLGSAVLVQSNGEVRLEA